MPTTKAEGKRRLEAIDPTKVYPKEVLQEASGFGVASIRRLRQEGMPVKYVCGRAFILGRDFIAAIEKGGEQKDG